MDITALTKLGLSPKEAKLYLKLLELGSARANSLAKALGQNRTTTYSLLGSMQNKGIVTFLTKKNIKYYSPADPTLLINSFIRDAKQLKGMLPQLLAISNTYTEKPKITYYEGLEGIKQIAEQLLEVPGSTRESFMGLEEHMIHPEMKRYIEEDFLPRRIEKNIHYRGIISGYLPMSTKHKKTEDAHLRELKYINPKELALRIHVDIFPENKVALYSYHKNEMMGVIIEHESFYNTMRTVFKLAWAGVDSFTK
jgi:HTH-type transcriptional regulator, sugar sensing transcriptional regulator